MSYMDNVKLESNQVYGGGPFLNPSDHPAERKLRAVYEEKEVEEVYNEDDIVEEELKNDKPIINQDFTD